MNVRLLNLRPFEPGHSSIFGRLMANVTEHTVDERLGACWLGTERTGRTRGGYIQVNARVPGLGGRVVHFSAHVLAWVAHETGLMTMDELYLAYLEVRHSGLVLDHECNVRECRRPSHLDPVTQQVNVQRRHERDRNRTRIAAPEPEEVEF